MLVLTRRIGEQIEVPCCNVTIEVLRIARSQVRLGVSAPAEVAVHRAEVVERLALADVPEAGTVSTRADGEIRTVVQRSEPRPELAASGHVHTKLTDRLGEWIARRTAGQIRSLTVEAREGGIVVLGYSYTYYGRQLVQAAVMELLNELDARPEEVDIRIEVAGRPR